MGEELTTEEEVIEKKEEVIDDAPQETVEDVAKQLGWNENFDGDGALSAKEFILNSRKIMDSQNKKNRHLATQLNELTGTIEHIKAHNEAVYKAEVSRLNNELEDLRAQRETAIGEGDAGAE